MQHFINKAYIGRRGTCVRGPTAALPAHRQPRSRVVNGHDVRRTYPVAPAIRLGHRVAHLAARVHGRSGVLHRLHRRSLFLDRAAVVLPHLGVLDQDFLDLVRDGRRLGNHHAVPVRHQLESICRRNSQYPFAVVRVRRTDGFFPRGRVSRRIAVRAKTRSAVGAFFRRRHGGDGNSVLFVLDPRRQQLDADAGRIRD